MVISPEFPDFERSPPFGRPHPREGRRRVRPLPAGWTSRWSPLITGC